MILTFPHMGHLDLILKPIFTSLGVSVQVPPPVTKRTLALGVRHSPETVCLPFKIMLGNFIEALEQGADTLLTCGGTGPCRLGMYAQVQQEILQQLGYKFNMLVAEPSLTSILGLLRELVTGGEWKMVYRTFQFAWAKLLIIDEIERRIAIIRPRECRQGDADVIFSSAIAALKQATCQADLQAIYLTIVSQLAEVAVHEKTDIIRIGLVGEIYILLEPFANQQLEKRLGRMGVEVQKTMQLSDYVQGHVVRSRQYRELHHRLTQLAEPYLNHYIGGHGLKSIAYTVEKYQQGVDGIIQAYPFTCMPEGIAKNILHQVSSETGMPVLNLVYDEHSGEAGLVTRLEAFVDLLRYRKQAMD